MPRRCRYQGSLAQRPEPEYGQRALRSLSCGAAGHRPPFAAPARWVAFAARNHRAANAAGAPPWSPSPATPPAVAAAVPGVPAGPGRRGRPPFLKRQSGHIARLGWAVPPRPAAFSAPRPAALAPGRVSSLSVPTASRLSRRAAVGPGFSRAGARPGCPPGRRGPLAAAGCGRAGPPFAGLPPLFFPPSRPPRGSGGRVPRRAKPKRSGLRARTPPGSGRERLLYLAPSASRARPRIPPPSPTNGSLPRLPSGVHM